MMFRKTIFAVIGLLTLVVGANANLLLTGAGSKGGGVVSCVLPLDCLSSTPTVALSVHKLRTAYAGPAIKVRATSGTLTDIGFSSNDLDVTALLNACPVDCWVVTIYDQMTNARDFTQATTTKQPQIVSGHALLSPVNGKPTMTFVSGSITTLAAAVPISTLMTSTAYTVMSSAHPTAGTANSVDQNGHILSDLTQGYFDHGSMSTASGWEFNHFDSGNHVITIAATYPATHVAFHTLNSGTESAALDGGTPSTSTSVGALGNTTGTPALGSTWNSSRSMDGTISELVVFNVAISSADANTIGSAMATYAGTTWTNIP